MKRALLAVAVLLVAFGVGVTPANAASGNVVRGLQSAPVATCAGEGSLGTYVMSGDLVGCWYTDSFVAGAMHPSGTASFSGTEHFTGCLDVDGDGVCGPADPWGTFRTSFVFSAKFSSVTGAEIHGRCHHPITGGDGAFSDATGVLNFHDNVTPTEVTADYSGPIRL